MFRSTIKHIRRGAEELGFQFYHPDCPILFANHDTIGQLSDCPFPLKTTTFEVLLFGTSRDRSGDLHDHERKLAVVEHTKRCGHTVSERITFEEGVQDFEHCGTIFSGASYSIKNWATRIELFRSGWSCEICQVVEHHLWCWSEGISAKSRKKSEASLLLTLNYNWENWQDFVSIDAYRECLKGITWDGGKVHVEPREFQRRPVPQDRPIAAGG